MTFTSLKGSRGTALPTPRSAVPGGWGKNRGRAEPALFLHSSELLSGEQTTPPQVPLPYGCSQAPNSSRHEIILLFYGWIPTNTQGGLPTTRMLVPKGERCEGAHWKRWANTSPLDWRKTGCGRTLELKEAGRRADGEGQKC